LNDLKHQMRKVELEVLPDTSTI